jgi:hypothetical protein
LRVGCCAKHDALFSCFCAVHTWYSPAVDIFNVTSGTWSTAELSMKNDGLAYLAAASFPNLGIAIFAGGGKSTG